MLVSVAVSFICAVSAYSSKMRTPRLLRSESSFFWITEKMMLMTRLLRNRSCLIWVSSKTMNRLPEKSVWVSFDTFS